MSSEDYHLCLRANGKYLAMSSYLLREHYSAVPGFEFSLAVVNPWIDKHFGAISTAYIEANGEMAVIRQIMPIGLGTPITYLIQSILLFTQAVPHLTDFMAKHH